MVGIFDVFHHQLPVARDALAVVAQQRQLACAAVIGFKYSINPRHNGRAKIRLDRFNSVAKGGKHQAMQYRNAQLGQAVVLDGKVFRHTTVDAITVSHTVFKRQTCQVTIELISPLVIRADKAAGVAVLRLAKTYATVGAAVFNHPDA